MKIDVIIPSYNSSEYLPNAIKSVLSQGVLLNKLMIIDDGSTDDTKAIVKKFQSKHLNIEYVHQPNKGLSSARNAGIKHSDADLIAFLDADDIWLKDKLVRQLKVFKEAKSDNLGLVYCNYSNIDESGKKIDKKTFILNPKMRGSIYKQMKTSNQIASSGSGVLIKKECFDKVGMFDENLTAIEDWDMWLRISKEYEVDYVSNTLVQIRHHKKNMQKDSTNMLKNYGKFYSKRYKEKIITKENLRQIRRKVFNYIIFNQPMSASEVKSYFTKELWRKTWRNKLAVAKDFVEYSIKSVIKYFSG